MQGVESGVSRGISIPEVKRLLCGPPARARATGGRDRRQGRGAQGFYSYLAWSALGWRTELGLKCVLTQIGCTLHFLS